MTVALLILSSQAIELLSHELYAVRETARRELAARGEEALEELSRAAESEDAELALAAVELLARLGERAVPALERAAFSENEAVASAAWDALVRLRGRGWMGVRISEVEGPEGEPMGGGVLVVGLLKDTPAENSGMKPGDVIVGFNGVEAVSVADLIRVVGATRPGTKSKVKLIRSGEGMEIELTVSRMPDQYVRR